MKKFGLLVASALVTSSLMAAAPMSSTSSNKYGIFIGSGANGGYESDGMGMTYNLPGYTFLLQGNVIRNQNTSGWFNTMTVHATADKKYALSPNSNQTLGLGAAVGARAPVGSQAYNPYYLAFNYGVNAMIAPKIRFELKYGLVSYEDSGDDSFKRKWSLGASKFIGVTKFL
jgi:hypothetical protein